MTNKKEGDEIGGDKLIAEGISDSLIAIGRGARVEVHYEYVERPEPGIPYLAPGLPLHHVPRLDELKKLIDHLKLGAAAATMLVLRGTGGVGKTTLAIALCHDKNVLEAFPDGVLWATLGPDGDVVSAQQAWAEALANDDLSKVTSLEARASRLRSLLHAKACLLVIDDVWEAEHLNHLQVGSQTCATLVTTRESKIAMAVGDEYQLDGLKPEEAIDLLDRWAGKRDVGTRDEAAELAKRLGYLPLALRLAGAQSLDDVKWADLLDHFRQTQGDLSVLDMDEPKQRVESLTLAFDLSLGRLNKALQEHFEMLGVFAAGREAPFDARAAAAVWQVTLIQAKKSLGRLARAALLDREGDIYTLHLLVGDYARSRLGEATRQAAEERHKAYYPEVAQRSEKDWQAAEAALPQMRTAWDRVAKDDADGLYAWAEATNEFFHRRGRWADSIAWLKTARAAVQATGQRRREGWCEHQLGYVFFLQGKMGEAFEQFQASLVIAREVGEPQIESQALNRIGYFCIQRGNLDEAFEQLQDSLDIARKVGDKAVEAESSHLIGLIHQQRGNLDEALAQYQISLAIQQEVGNWRMEAATLLNIGRIYAQRGELMEALKQLHAGLAIQRELGDQFSESVNLAFIGRIYEQQGKLDDALAQYQTSLAIQRKIGNQAWVARSLNGIGRIHLRRGELAQALELFQDSLAMLREAGDLAGQAESLWHMGCTCEKMEHLTEAEGLLAEALALYKTIGMPEAAQVCKDLDRVRSQLGRGEN